LKGTNQWLQHEHYVRLTCTKKHLINLYISSDVACKILQQSQTTSKLRIIGLQFENRLLLKTKINQRNAQINSG